MLEAAVASSPNDLAVHDGGIERAPQVVQRTLEIDGQRRQPARRASVEHQVTRGDFTAWMPYFASLL
jgi:hypothetical protein